MIDFGRARQWPRTVTVVLALGLLAGACSGGDTTTPSGAGSPGTSSAKPRPEDMAPDQTLTLFSFFKPVSFDPGRQGAGTSGGNAFGRQYAEPLLKPTPITEGKDPDVVPAAAESYQASADGLTYTFNLRADGRYNDGQSVRAQDFVFAWRRLIDPRSSAPFGPKFANAVKGGKEAAALKSDTPAATVEAALDQLGLAAPDDRTFQVTLAQPALYFKWVASLHQGAPIRQDVVERGGSDTWGTKPETLVTNGRFMVSDIGQTSTTMVPNPHYREKPILTRLVSFYGIGQAPSWTKYLNNELDISNGPLLAARDAALKDPSYQDEILRFPELSIQWLEFNTTKPPFDNVAVRLAFAQAIDRESFAKLAVDKGSTPSSSYIPKGMPGYNPRAGAAQEFDPDKAKATLNSSGVDKEQLKNIEVITSSVFTPDALLLKDQIERNLGVSLVLTEIGDSAALNARVKQGDFQVRTTFQGHSANYPDPQDFFDAFLSNSADNTARWKNPEYDRLVLEADRSTDPAKRSRLYDQAHEILVREAPVAFLLQLERVFWVKPWVKGITRTQLDSAAFPGDLYSGNIWIAKH